MNNLNLSPLQSIYDRSSKAMDSLENEIKLIAVDLKKRIDDIIKDKRNYELDFKEQFDIGIAALYAIIEMTSGSNSGAHEMAFTYDDLIRYMILDGVKHINNRDHFPEYVNRMAFLQYTEPFSRMTKEAKKELNTLLILFVELTDILNLQFLYATNQSSSVLPSRNDLNSLVRNEEPGISNKTWVKYAA